MTGSMGGAVAARRALLALLQPSRGGYMWRTTKASVQHELGIPKQTTSVVRLDLNAIQKHELRRAVREARPLHAVARSLACKPLAADVHGADLHASAARLSQHNSVVLQGVCTGKSVLQVRNSMFEWLPPATVAAVMDGAALPAAEDRHITPQEQTKVMKALDTTRKVRINLQQPRYTRYTLSALVQACTFRQLVSNRLSTCCNVVKET